ncbi:MAG: DUF5107 domain-containing protein [Ginsengibacter sp.]
MRKFFSTLLICFSFSGMAQQNAVIHEYNRSFSTYPFSDPNPIPSFTKIYPYFRYDGFTDTPVQKEWKVVELENDYIKVMILPEIGGKIWSAIEKSTGKSFLYYNHVVKFRDVAMRGPWTSGGIEANYGIIGHTPNIATPVDYITRKNDDGSVSCIIGVLDLLTRTNWRMEINLPAGKAYFTTRSFWYNSTPLEQPYYHWMNTGIKAKGNLQFIFPGTHYIGHEGEYSDWPINKQNGKDISFYENNNFGSYKSYHVFGKYTDFFGGYWHDDKFGMARYSTHDAKAGKKIWIWGLSRQGMIWEKLLTDSDGQYVEIQSGRLFNQSAEKSTFTPFKHRNFSPYATDVWTEYWYPVLNTRGFVEAGEYGALNLKYEGGWLKIYFSPVQHISDKLLIKEGDKTIYTKDLTLTPLKTFADSIKINVNPGNLVAVLGDNKLIYNASPAANVLSRPIESPKDFDWNSTYGLYVEGEEFMDQKLYPLAEKKLEATLKKDHNFFPALVKMAELMYRNLRYDEALVFAKRALSINTNDGGANYYYGLINAKLGNVTDAKDGFDLASLSSEYKSPAYTELARLYLKENYFEKSNIYASGAIDFNRYNIEALQVQAIDYRYQNDPVNADKVLNSILSFDPLNHFVRFERYLWQSSDENKKLFTSLIRDEQPQETFLELATGYYNTGCLADCEKVLQLAPTGALVDYWLAFLQYKQDKNFNALLEKANDASPEFVFPFRSEDEEVLLWAGRQNKNWKTKYYLALIYKERNRIDEAVKLFVTCGTEPGFAPFYAARAELLHGTQNESAEKDLKKAIELDKEQWRYHKLLGEYYVTRNQNDKALFAIDNFYRSHPENYIIGMLYAKTLLLNKRYSECDAVLSKLNIIPFEGATVGKELYHEAKLMMAIKEIQNKKFDKALQFIADAKIWPDNLGVGKPYQDDLDERLEDWLSYLCYKQMNKKNEAQASLENISKFHPQIENTTRNFLPANSLVTAWTLQKLQSNAQAIKWLNSQIDQYRGNKILEWCRQMFENKIPARSEIDDAGVRLLQQVMLLKMN